MSNQKELTRDEKRGVKNCVSKGRCDQMTHYHVLLVKPYFKDGEKRFGYTRIGVAFRKNMGDLIDIKLDLFPVLTEGAFIQLRSVGILKREAA